jgi:hypothetical protein
MTRKQNNVAKLAANAIVIALAGEEAAQPIVIQIMFDRTWIASLPCNR